MRFLPVAYRVPVTTPLQRVLVACRAMESTGGPIDLTELAAQAGCSARQLQRDFAAVIGAPPVEYGRSVRTLNVRRTLRRQDSVTDALHDAGYGSVRAFYEEAGRRLGMTPSEYASSGSGVQLIWSITPSAIGQIIAVASPRGLAAVRIGSDADALVTEITREFADADLVRADDAMVDVMRALRAIALSGASAQLPLDVRGTAFQAAVWHAIARIPEGQTRTYRQIADEIGSPTSVRAVAAACARNRAALVIPCHRVIRTDGSLAGYAWGLEVKEQLIDLERAHASGRISG